METWIRPSVASTRPLSGGENEVLGRMNGGLPYGRSGEPGCIVVTLLARVEGSTRVTKFPQPREVRENRVHGIPGDTGRRP